MSEAAHEVRVPEWTVGDRLRKAREHAGMKQSELAEAIGIGRRSVVTYESSERLPKIIVVRAWALVTGVPVEWLLGIPSAGAAGNVRFLPTPHRDHVSRAFGQWHRSRDNLALRRFHPDRRHLRVV